jgi:hypothetical protein
MLIRLVADREQEGEGSIVEIIRKDGIARTSPWRSRFAALASSLAIGLGFAGIAQAHHSYAMFDMTHTDTIRGTVKEFQWTNPHGWIEVLVDTPDGPKQYSVEGNNLRVMTSAGWKFNSLKPGDKVTIQMHPLRDGRQGGSLVSAELPDGRKLGEH